jgi:hypothetical protein
MAGRSAYRPVGSLNMGGIASAVDEIAALEPNVQEIPESAI